MQERNLLRRVDAKYHFVNDRGPLGRVSPWNSWLGCASRFSSSSKCPDPISDRKNVIFHTRFQIFLTKIHTHFQTRHRQKSCHHCLDIKEHKLKDFLRFHCTEFAHIISFREFIRYRVVPSKTIPDSRPKWANPTPRRFQTETAQNPYCLGGQHAPIWIIGRSS